MSNTPDENKQIVRKLFEDAVNRNHFELIDQLIGPEYVDGTGERGPGAFKQVMVRLHGAFPDLHYTLDAILAEGDQVALRWHWSGTHRGPFRGLAPTGRSLTNSGAAIFRLSGGKIVAAELETDRLGFLQGVGVVPPTEALFQPRAAGVVATPAE